MNIFGCRHKRITRPITPVKKAPGAEPTTYVVCLECGRQFVYDLQAMRVGPPVPASPGTGVLESDSPRRNKVLRYAAVASVAPVLWTAARFFTSAKRSPGAEKDGSK